MGAYMVCPHACETVGTDGQGTQNRHRYVSGFSVEKVIIYSRAGGITLITTKDPWGITLITTGDPCYSRPG